MNLKTDSVSIFSSSNSNSVHEVYLFYSSSRRPLDYTIYLSQASSWYIDRLIMVDNLSFILSKVIIGAVVAVIVW